MAYGTSPNESKPAIMLGIVLLTSVIAVAGIAMMVAFYFVTH